MAHMELELAQDRQRSLLAAAAQRTEARRALIHNRTVRQAERAERKTLCHAQTATQLRARIAELEVGV
jgi:hypothetical protein